MEYCGCALLLGSLWLSWINLFFIKLVSESWNTKFDIHSPVAVSTKLYSASTRPPQSPSSPKEQEVKLTKAKPPFGSSSSVNGDFMYSVYIYNHLPNTVNSTPRVLPVHSEIPMLSSGFIQLHFQLLKLPDPLKSRRGRRRIIELVENGNIIHSQFLIILIEMNHPHIK